MRSDSFYLNTHPKKEKNNQVAGNNYLDILEKAM